MNTWALVLVIGTLVGLYMLARPVTPKNKDTNRTDYDIKDDFPSM